MTTMLPAKKYHRLEEVAACWHCTIDDLLYLAEEGKLAIALPPEPITDRFYYISNPRDFSKTLSNTNESDVPLVFHSPEEARYLCAAPRLRFPPPYLENRRFTVDNLVIPHEELERFEQENGISDDPNSESDAALGRDKREQLRSFARTQAEEKREARAIEWDHWKKEATRIQTGRTRKYSKNALAGKVKESLDLPDSIETIRKRI